jgi:hypothetical protein
MKPHEPKNRDKTRAKKRREKKRAIKNQTEKRRKGVNRKKKIYVYH